MSTELFLYLDDLLMLQSSAADRHNHKGVLGAVKEDFIKQLLEQRVDDIKVCTGEIASSLLGELGQHDVMIRKRGINPELGGQVRLSPEACSAVIEVKSNAKGADITKFDQKAILIKQDNPKVLCGLVCYKLACKKETILKRCGFVYDSELDGFIKDESIEVQYNGLDFILSLDDEEEETYNKAFYIKKGLEFNLIVKPPYTEYFLMEINGLVT